MRIIIQIDVAGDATLKQQARHEELINGRIDGESLEARLRRVCNHFRHHRSTVDIVRVDSP